MENFEDVSGKQDKFHRIISELRNYTDVGVVKSSLGVQMYNEDIFHKAFGEHELKHRTNNPYTGKNMVIGRFVIPIYTPLGNLVSYVAFDAINYFKKSFDKSTFITYLEPYNQKNKPIFAPKNSWNLIMESEYVGVTDGVWDAIYLNYIGFPTFSLRQSSLSKENVEILKCFQKVYIFSDNDTAGFRLFQEASNSLATVFRVTQDVKDIDDFLKYHGKDEFYRQFMFNMNTHLKGEILDGESNLEARGIKGSNGSIHEPDAGNFQREFKLDLQQGTY